MVQARNDAMQCLESEREDGAVHAPGLSGPGQPLMYISAHSDCAILLP